MSINSPARATNCCIVASLSVKPQPCCVSIKRKVITAMYRRIKANGLPSRPQSSIANMNKNTKARFLRAHKGTRDNRAAKMQPRLSHQAKVAANPAEPNGPGMSLFEQTQFFNNLAPLPMMTR